MPKILAIFGNVALYGQERSNIHVFNTLRNKGYELLLLVNDRGFHWHLQPEVDAHFLNYKKIRFPWNFRKTLKIKSLLLYLMDTVRYNIEFLNSYKKYKPDYIHIANDFFYMTLWPTLIFVNCPIIFRLGDKPTRRFFYEKWLWKYFIIKRTKHFVCISKFIATELKKIDPTFKRLSVIYNIPPTRKATIKENLPQKDDSKFTVLYVGQLNKIKGVHILFEAAIKLMTIKKSKFRFIFAGQIYQSDLFKEISKSSFYKKNRESLIFTDKVQNIHHLYQISDVVVVPSLVEEALSNIVGEAKQAMCPAIVFNSGGLSELIQHKVNGYICNEKNAESIIDAISYYLNNPNTLEKARMASYDSILHLGLTQDMFTQKWISVYN
ncbi:glycosyltransferase family 4 protein [Alkalitalea saponilacus]|uniref:Glycosyltransferase involved in cell wall bisynthesis n=1 Tax=Alkalitalea saponilacus TaxID=889453 RepID=A0A1T5GZB6_9BACT|nr:glycosyltransferase family 4 protein [Alkalitalea saponilacus]ASB50969.1 hypothetical protein CDL62_18360 [Alkalitalea saponilacus]SKC13767.1 Glycosyltransferase involved in cell wall bisynthesis [Alkalitalea saponilacus]